MTKLLSKLVSIKPLGTKRASQVMAAVAVPNPEQRVKLDSTAFSGLYREVEVIVVATTRIEFCLASFAYICAAQILANAYLCPTRSAHDSRRIPFVARPGFDGVASQ